MHFLGKPTLAPALCAKCQEHRREADTGPTLGGAWLSVQRDVIIAIIFIVVTIH